MILADAVFNTKFTSLFNRQAYYLTKTAVPFLTIDSFL